MNVFFFKDGKTMFRGVVSQVNPFGELLYSDEVGYFKTDSKELTDMLKINPNCKQLKSEKKK